MTTNIPIEVVPYDPGWPEQFKTEKARIQAASAPFLLRIEHIGSTAVPGLAAKPVIDILIAVTSLSDDVHFIPPLESLGYVYVQKHEAVFPQRRYLHLIRENRHLVFTCTWLRKPATSSVTSCYSAMPCAPTPTQPLNTLRLSWNSLSGTGMTGKPARTQRRIHPAHPRTC